MGPQTKKVDIFGSFLGGASPPVETIVNTPQAGSDADPDAATVEREILNTLQKTDGFVAVKDLLAGNVSRPTVAAQVINDLEKFGLVEKSKSRDDLEYRLTGLGKGLAAS
jgi:predicted transcriptional regulator